MSQYGWVIQLIPTDVRERAGDWDSEEGLGKTKNLLWALKLVMPEALVPRAPAKGRVSPNILELRGRA